jgi:anti-sigma factor RsiW
MQLTCQELVELLTDYLEAALDEPTVRRVEEHLALCDGCVTYVDQMNATVAALRRLPREPVPGDLHRAIALALGATAYSNGARLSPDGIAGASGSSRELMQHASRSVSAEEAAK